jgi:hypothetical protein
VPEISISFGCGCVQRWQVSHLGDEPQEVINPGNCHIEEPGHRLACSGCPCPQRLGELSYAELYRRSLEEIAEANGPTARRRRSRRTS